MPPHNLSRGDADIVAGLKYGTRFRAIRQDNRPLRSAPVRKPANASNTGPHGTWLIYLARRIAKVTGNADRENGGRFRSLEHSPEAV
jgi:hypothetical protein